MPDTFCTLAGTFIQSDGSPRRGVAFRIEVEQESGITTSDTVVSGDAGEYSTPLALYAGASYRFVPLSSGLPKAFYFAAPSEGSTTHVIDLAPTGAPVEPDAAAALTAALNAHIADETDVHGQPDPHTVVVTTDPRLTDARPPTAHGHAPGDVGADPAGTAASLVGALTIPDSPGDIGAATAAQGAKADTAVQPAALATHEADTTAVHGIADTAALVVTTDPRLSDARTPTAHTHDDRYFTETEADSRFVRTVNGTGPDGSGNVTVAGGGGGVTDHGALAGLGDDDHTQYALADGTRGAFAAPLGANDNYVTDAEKAALHAHSNKAALDLVSGTNTGDQVLPTWSTIAGKPAVVAEGATQALARTAIGAGTSSLAIGTTGSTAAAGNRAATETATGMVELATTTEATTGTDTVRAVTPAGVKAVADTKANVSHTHTASQVSDSTTTGRALLTAADAATARTALGLGTAATTTATAYATAAQGVKADSAVQPTIVNAKGDLIVGTAADTVARLPASTNGHVLTIDSAEAAGMKWAAPAGGGGGGASVAWSGVNVGGHLPVWANGGHAAFSMETTRIIPCPLVAVQAMNVDAVSIYVDTGVATSTVDLALYTYDLATGKPGSFVQHLATIDTSTGGLKTATFAPIALAAGIHVVIGRANTASVTLRGVTDSIGIYRMNGPDGGSNQYGLPHATWTGTVPSWPSTPTWNWSAGVHSASAHVPKLQLRRSA